jgi:hypothetical protein
VNCERCGGIVRCMNCVELPLLPPALLEAHTELLTQVHDLLIEIVNSRVGCCGTSSVYTPQLDRLQCDMLCAAVGAIVEVTPTSYPDADCKDCGKVTP